MSTSRPLAVYLEVGARRTFAAVAEWPGWCRSGKDEEDVLETLAAYAERYSVVAGPAGIRFPASAAEAFEVVERLPGSASTDFGAPGEIASGDHARLTGHQAKRQAALVAATWRVLDDVVAGAPAALRKGPRGGGRDRDAVAEHVLEAENSYARKIGIRQPAPAPGDSAAISAQREAILAVLGRASSGEPVVERGWPPRYAARRIAWHVLDHAWEIEDKSQPG